MAGKNLSFPSTFDKKNKNDKYYLVARVQRIGIFGNCSSAEEQTRVFSCLLLCEGLAPSEQQIF